MSAQRTTDTEDELELALLASVVCLIRCGLGAVNGNPEHLDNALSHVERSLQRLAGQVGDTERRLGWRFDEQKGMCDGRAIHP